ncbi:polyphosphate kinase 2 [Ferrovibrio sp.]|uniref:polyphosphate kinase 2 n=1 Tax=Ferrovibrio sp. TaxID=1917215 RepID=UPI003519653C
MGRRQPENGDYQADLRKLQIQLVRLQRHLIASGEKMLVIIEGRDGAGKDGTIKRITEHMSPRETRVVALGKPSDREQTQWYFQRHVAHLPAAGEFVLFNRSWYNRAGVERVMGFCTDAEYEAFMGAVPVFEELLVRSGIRLVKYYLDIHRREQEKRLAARTRDPLKQWKVSPIDKVALKHWKAYSRARDAMLSRCNSVAAPWVVVRADDKKTARLNLIRDLLSRLDYEGKAAPRQIAPDRRIVFPFDVEALHDGRLAG